MSADESIAIGTWALVIVTLLGGIAVLAGLFDSLRVRKEQVTLLRRQETVRMYSSTIDARALAGAQLPPDRDSGAVRKFIESARRDEAKNAAIRHYLNYWEGIAAAVEFEVLDKQLLEKLVGGRLRAIWENYAPYIAGRREALNAPGLFIELERLATGWGALSLADALAADAEAIQSREGGSGEEE